MIIRISGLPGSGKTTLGEMLEERLKYKLFRIDHYREEHREEFLALHNLFEDMWFREDNFILDSMGFNRNIIWVFKFLPRNVVDIKLICEMNVLKDRIKQKVLPEDEYFPYIGSRFDYVESFFADMAHKDCDILIDTSHISKDTMLRCALDGLKPYMEVEKDDKN